MKHLFQLLMILLPALAGAQTLTFDDASVLQAHPRRIGQNLGSLAYFNDGQMLKNLLGTENPGFEPFAIQQIWVTDEPGTATTFTTNDQYDPVAENYWKGAHFSLVGSESGGKERGCSGEVAGNSRSDYKTGKGVTFTFAAPCVAPIVPGDVMIVTLITPSTPESIWEGDRNAGGNGIGTVHLANGGRLTSLTTGLCASCGAQSLVMDATAPRSSAGFTQYYDNMQIANTQPDLYVLHRGTFQLSFDAKIVSGNPVLRANVERLSTSANRIRCAPFTPQLTARWTEYTANCTAQEAGISTGDPKCVAGGDVSACTAPGPVDFSVSVSGGAVAFDNLSFQKISGRNPQNPTIFRDEVVAALVRSGSEVLRYWSGQNGQNAWNWTQPSYAVQQFYAGTGAYQGSAGATFSLNEFLELCRTVQKISGKPVVPYIELPTVLQGDDPVNVAQFLDAPASTEYGARRAALGQKASWTTVFHQIDLSFCNECWNFAFAAQNLTWRKHGASYYGDYTLRAHDIFQPIRTRDKYFPPKIIKLGIGYQTGTNFQGDLGIANTCGPKKDGCPDYIELNDYTSLDMSPPSMDAAWASALVEPYNNVYNPHSQTKFYDSMNDYQKQHLCGPEGNSPCEVAVYEENNSTVESCGKDCKPPAVNITQKEEDEITAGAGQGVVIALESLLNEQFGVLNQSLFSLAGDYNGTSNPPGLYAKLWGDVVDMGGSTNNVRPQFLGLEVVNEAIRGEMTACRFTSGLPTYDYPGDEADNHQPAMKQVPWLYAFCFRDGDTRSFVLINTSLSDSYKVEFAGSAPPKGKISVTQYAPASMNLLNESYTGTPGYLTPAAVSLTRSTLTGPASVTVPAHSVTTYVFQTGAPGGTSATGQ